MFWLFQGQTPSIPRSLDALNSSAEWMLQDAAGRCRTLQDTAGRCRTLQDAAGRSWSPQGGAAQTAWQLLMFLSIAWMKALTVDWRSPDFVTGAVHCVSVILPSCSRGPSDGLDGTQKKACEHDDEFHRVSLLNKASVNILCIRQETQRPYFKATDHFTLTVTGTVVPQTF
ncbi:uncharacterized protein V6R79_018525 [Siganus canaliculatus]